jgi:outer membrane protein assembly factor BamA
MTFAITPDIILKLTTGAGYPPTGTFFQGEKQQMKKLSGAGIFRFITLLPVLTMLSFNAAAVTVAEVVFEQTSEPKLITDLFKHQVSVRVGQELDQKKINADLKNLFDTGVINPPDVRIEPVDGENVKVVYMISARPVVAFLTFEGNNKFDDQEIRKRLEVSQGQPLNNKALENSVAAIREFYHEKGMDLSSVARAFARGL